MTSHESDIRDWERRTSDSTKDIKEVESADYRNCTVTLEKKTEWKFRHSYVAFSKLRELGLIILFESKS